MTFIKTCLASTACLLLGVCAVCAQEQTTPPVAAAGSSTAAQPLEVTADTALEWDRQKLKYYARGHAMAKQGDFQVEGDTLTADYRDNPDGGGAQIYKLTAEGHVTLTNGLNKGYGDHAVYDVDTALATMTGGNLRIETPNMKITAKDKFEYYSNEGKMIAYGAPVITNKDSTLTADLVTAWTAPKADTEKAPGGETQAGGPSQSNGQFKGLKRAEATGHVVITTPKEKATSDKAVYTGDNDTVTLYDHVRLLQGPNTLEGVKAEMNLTTKLSRMVGAPGPGGRVKGVFFPSSQKKPPQ